MVGNGQSLHCQIAYMPKVLPIEQIRAVSQFPLSVHVYVHGGKLFRQSPFGGRDHILLFHTAFSGALMSVSYCIDLCQG